MTRLLAAFLFFASPAFADEATVAASHHKDYPTSSLYVSPADASRFNEPALGALFSYGRSLSRTKFDAGQLNDDAASQGLSLRLVRKASPSLYWGVALTRYDEQDEANNTLITGERKLKTRRARVEAGPEAAYKFMDKVVLGLGLKYRQVETRPESGKSLSLTHPVAESALLVRSEWYEAELAQRVLSYEQATDDGKQRVFRREATLAARYHSSAALTLGLRVTRNPVPNCCLAPETRRVVFGVTTELTQADLKSEVLFTYAPGYHDGGIQDVPRHGLNYTLHYELNRVWAVLGMASFERGAERDSEVAVPTAAGTVTRAEVAQQAWSLSLGSSLSL